MGATLGSYVDATWASALRYRDRRTMGARTALHCTALAWCTVAIQLLGCTRSDPKFDVAAVRQEANVAHHRNVERHQEHDFGVILAEVQTLQHEFTVENTTNKSVHLLRATATTPCCSGFVSLPRLISPNDKVRVAVWFKTNHDSGLKGVRFVLETDEGYGTTHVLVVRARLVPAWEVEPVGDSVTPLRLGKRGSQAFRLTARRKDGRGRSIPERLSASAPLAVAFNGEATSAIDAAGFIVETGMIEVSIPPVREPGPYRGQIVLHWSDGLAEAHPFDWEVQSDLKASPSAFILRAPSQPTEYRIVVTAAERPFRVLSVQSPLVAGPLQLSSRAGLRQELRLTLDPARAPNQRTCEIEIRTDHPDEKTLRLSILVLREGRGVQP
jgi:hypothetical protein